MKYIILSLFVFFFSCKKTDTKLVQDSSHSEIVKSVEHDTNRISKAAMELTKDRVVYDGSYFVIDYPNGDVPNGKGVCTDVVIRALRKVGIDLQKEVHEDMKNNFNVYPKIWGLQKPDNNIDHRRVPNLRTFFERKGYSQQVSQIASDYIPGDVVSWVLQGGLTHIGVVVAPRSEDGKRHLIVHNIGGGQVMEDVLFSYTITGHYRIKLEK